MFVFRKSSESSGATVLPLLARFGEAGDDRARLDVFLRKPSLVHLERIACLAAGAMGIGGLRLHVLDVDDLAGLINKGHGQRHKCVFHPHANLGRPVEQKHHARIGRQFFTKHQALLALRLGRCHFCLDDIHARGQGYHGKLRLRANAAKRQQGGSHNGSYCRNFHGQKCKPKKGRPSLPFLMPAVRINYFDAATCMVFAFFTFFAFLAFFVVGAMAGAAGVAAAAGVAGVAGVAGAAVCAAAKAESENKPVMSAAISFFIFNPSIWYLV